MGTCLLSQSLEGLPCGIIITASHNKYTDNGLKISGFNGESITSNYEVIFMNLINSNDLMEGVKQSIKEIYKLNAGNKYFFRDYKPIVSLACDTRRSSPKLVKIAEECLTIYKSLFHYYGVLSTPALQFLTFLNQILFRKINSVLSQFYFVKEIEYWNFFKGVYFAFDNFSQQFFELPKESKYENRMLIDCANGVAGYIYGNIINILDDKIETKFINSNYEKFENLNEKCGAEHLHKSRSLPANYPDTKFTKNVSFDGDVDRIIYL